MNYSPKSFTYGFELEIGDVSRNKEVPTELGSWEYSETDVLNLKEPYANICCDPLGISPPVGGEINIRPSKTIDGLVEKINKTLQFFNNEGTTNCISHNHIHIRVPGLREDIDGLKNLMLYIKNNQQYTIDHIYDFKKDPGMTETRTTNYFKFDGGRPTPEWMIDNIINKASNFDEFIALHACGKDGISRGRPFRYAINTYCMKHIDTIEFRLFRHSFNLEEIRDSLIFVREFISSALNGGPSAKEIIESKNLEFPKFRYDHQQCLAWKTTKYPSDRGKKERRFYSC